MKKKILLLFIVISELTLIAFLTGEIYLKSSQVLGEKISISPISKDDVIFPNIESGSDLKDFYEPKPNQSKTSTRWWLPSDFKHVATINADSLNERFDYSIDKDPEVFRIVALGDSFTYGLFVNTNENYPERLEDILNKNLTCPNIRKFEVINLGVGGYDIEYAVERFKKRGQKYNPDLVLWLAKDDDFFMVNEIMRPRKKQYKEEILADEAMLKRFYSEGSFSPWSGKAAQELMEELGEEGVLAYSKKALEGINDYYKGKLIFITIVGWLNDSYLSVLQSFTNGRNDTYFYDGLNPSYDRFEDGHPTSKGYEQIAGEIFEYLIKNRLVPCGA